MSQIAGCLPGASATLLRRVILLLRWLQPERPLRALGLSLLLLFSAAVFANAQTSLASRVLVVYIPSDSNSVAVANHYQSKRGIPAANMCAVNLNPNNYTGSISDYRTMIQAPIENCLNAVGPQQILYIVLAWFNEGIVLNPYQTNPLFAYSIDSYLEDIWDQYSTQYFYPYPTRPHPYYTANQSQGQVYAPFISLAQYRSLNLPLIYSVWRLDGSNPQMAMSLVDNAMAAEAAGGPITLSPGANPSACIDMQVNPTVFPDVGYRSADWDLYRAAQFLSATSAFNVVSDENAETFGTPPAPNCLNTGLYAGWYNYDTYNDAFSWDAGSIGWDLDSQELYSIRSGPYWGAVALQKGLTVTSGPILEPYLEGIPHPSGVTLDLLSGANVGDAFLRNTQWIKWRIDNIGDPLYQPYAAKLPPFNAPPALFSLSLSPQQIVGGYQTAAVVGLPFPATSNMTVSILSNCGLSYPSSVTIPSGQSSANFVVGTPPVSSEVDCIITAATDSSSVGNTNSLYPLLSNVDLSSTSVQGGTPVQATVFLNASAPFGGTNVQLSSDQESVASVPASVFVPAGLSEIQFTITTYAVAQTFTVNITASNAGATATSQLTITPEPETAQ
jgi:uncharacterized protein (TIGR03790 family)